MSNGEWTRRAAEDARLTVAARIGTVVLALFAAPAAGWSMLNIVNHGERLGVIESMLVERTLDRYPGAEAAADFALRDERAIVLTKAVERLAGVVDLIFQRQNARLPIFDQMSIDIPRRLDRLEERVFNTPATVPPR